LVAADAGDPAAVLALALHIRGRAGLFVLGLEPKLVIRWRTPEPEAFIIFGVEADGVGPIGVRKKCHLL
jgi:hypothetical protein